MHRYSKFKPAHSVGYRFGLAVYKTGCVVYAYGMNYELASKGCLGSCWLAGDEASDLISEIEAIKPNRNFDECELIDLVLGEYALAFDENEPVNHHFCSSDGLLVQY